MNEEKIDIILKSIEGVERANPEPFFFTRVMARLENRLGQNNPWVKTSKIITQPGFAIGFIILLFGLNAVLLFFYKSNNTGRQSSSPAELFAANFVSGANIEDVNFFEQ